MKNKSAGFYLTILTVLLSVAALVCYIWNCRTDYFVSYGINKAELGFLIAGILAEIAVLAAGKGEPKAWKDLFPVAGAAFLMAAAVWFIGLRVNEAAFIMTFQKNASTLADLQSAVAGIICCLAASVLGMCAAFFDVEKAR